MSDIKDWTTAAPGNDSAPPHGFPEGMDRPDLNDSSRELMAAFARLWRDFEWGDFWEDSGEYTLAKVDNDTFTIDSLSNIDVTGYFPTNRRVKILPGPVYGYVDSTGYGAGLSTINLIMDSGDAVPAVPTDAFVYILESIRMAAFLHESNFLTQGRHTVSVPATAIIPMLVYGCDDISRSASTSDNYPDHTGLIFNDVIAATGAAILTNNPSDGESLSLNGVTWTFMDTKVGADETEIQGNLALTLTQLVADLQASGDGDIDDATYTEAGGDTLVITHDTPGAAGNLYDLGSGGGLDVTLSGSTLTGGSGKQYATFRFEIPKSWDVTTGTLQMELALFRPTGEPAGDVVFGAAAQALGDGDSMVAAFGGEKMFNPVTLTNTNTRYLTGELPVTMTVGGTPTGDGEMMIVRIVRDPGDGGDTQAGGCAVMGARVYVDYDAGNDD